MEFVKTSSEYLTELDFRRTFAGVHAALSSHSFRGGR